MQVPIRQEISRIPTRARLCENLQRKRRRPRAREPRRADFVRACAEMHHGHLRRTRLCKTLTMGQTLCEPAQSTCTWTSQKSPFMREFTMKMPQSKTLTTPPSSRNAHGHLRRARLYENLQENAAPQMEHPDLTPALTPTVRTAPQCGHTAWGNINKPNQFLVTTRCGCQLPG